MDYRLLSLAGVAVAAGGAYLIFRTNTRSILRKLFPEGFTATYAQLDCLEANGYTKDTKVYQEAVHIAYNDVAASCPGQDIGYTGALGYYCMG
jgi:hypothetical protein